jgi:hypothetical protein
MWRGLRHLHAMGIVLSRLRMPLSRRSKKLFTNSEFGNEETEEMPHSAFCLPFRRSTYFA